MKISKTDVGQRETFVTIVDKNFIPQLLVMLDSLSRFSNSYHVWIFCLDSDTYFQLSKISNIQKYTKLIEVVSIITPDIARVREERSVGEFAWTLTPFLPIYIFKLEPSISRVTYVDADLYFKNDPAILINIFDNSKKSILLTPHDFSEGQDLSHIVGKFCVQFLTVTRGAAEFLNWWGDKCIDWCGSTPSDGKFGDQKYLDDVPLAFPKDFFILENTYLTQGPWNMKKFSPADAVFFHFHGVRIRKTKVIISGTLPNRIYWGGMYFEYLTKLFEKIRKSNTDIFQFKLFSDSPLLNRNNIFRLINLILRRNLLILTEKKLRKSI